MAVRECASYSRALASEKGLSTKRALGSSSKDSWNPIAQRERQHGSPSPRPSELPLRAMAWDKRVWEWGTEHEPMCPGDANLGLRLITEKQLSELLFWVVKFLTQEAKLTEASPLLPPKGWSSTSLLPPAPSHPAFP